MRFIWMLIILQATNAANNNSLTKVFLDLSDKDDNAFLWQNLFTKLNTILGETEKLSQAMADVHKRQDDLENRLTKAMENVYESRVESMKRQQDQENILKTLMENLQEIREDTKKRQEEQKQHLVWASRQEEQEKRLTQLASIVTASHADTKMSQEDDGCNLTKLTDNFQDLTKRLDNQDALLRQSFNHSLKWTTIQRRQDGSVDFKRKWNDYSNGFGHPDGDYFIGLQKLHDITTYGPPQELMIILKDFDGQTRYAKYDLFRIGSEAEKYALLELGAYSGDAGNNLLYHKGNWFSTIDQDNDKINDKNCAEIFSGGWWFGGQCYSCYLNGPYRQQNQSNTSGINWNGFRPWNHSLKYAEMMIRAKL